MINSDQRLFEELGVRLQDYCVCGRSTKAIHCPFCGSTDARVSKRGSKTASVTLPDGTRKRVTVFNCQRCGKSYQENDCFRDCKAFVTTWRSENKTAQDIQSQVQKTGVIPEAMREALIAIAKKNPKYRQTIQDRLAESGPGLLERVDIERGKATIDERTALEIADEERKQLLRNEKETSS